uniref:TRAP transporter small permease n=1 Tax=Marinobacterium profundum TaxID=1714300 RepID=UPI00082F26FE|nr:TRAP transporter small permease subunit [Marinobacterium profundum]
MIHFIQKLSDGIGCCERVMVRALVLALPVMILANVISRAIKTPIFWLDELAVLTMVWLAMIGLSMTLKSRDAVAVTLLQDAVPLVLKRCLVCIADILVLFFTLALLVLCYVWFDPVRLIGSGLDIEVFAAQSFNFVYQEPTATLGIAKHWFWLILPLVALCSSVHALANLLQTLTASQAKFAEHVVLVNSGE